MLALASVVDPELFLGFEITHDRTVLFYLGIFGTVWAVARGIVPEESLVFDPEFALNNVIEYTHYFPAHWRGRLHSDEVRREFSGLYQMKIVIFLEELLSLIFTPFILWFSLPKCSDRLVDFFREFTIHVDGLGYVCSFAVFDFQRGPERVVPDRLSAGPAARLREDYYSTKDGKMLASYFGFLDNYAHQPRPGGGPAGHPTSEPQAPPIPHVAGHASLSPGDITGIAASRRQQRFPLKPSRHIAGESIVSPAHAAALRTGRFEPPDSGSSLLDSRRPAMSSSPLRHRLPLRYASLDPPATDHHNPQAAENDTGSAVGHSRGDGGEAVASSGDAGGGSAAASGGPTTSGEMSHLGESWRTTRAAANDDDDDQEDDPAHRADDLAANREAGVLGLLYQFQRAHTEGRGGGVTI